MEKTVEVTLKLTLEVPADYDAQELAESIQAGVSTKDTSFAAQLWKLGCFVDMYVQSIEERNVTYYVDQE